MATAVAASRRGTTRHRPAAAPARATAITDAAMLASQSQRALACTLSSFSCSLSCRHPHRRRLTIFWLFLVLQQLRVHPRMVPLLHFLSLLNYYQVRRLLCSLLPVQCHCRHYHPGSPAGPNGLLHQGLARCHRVVLLLNVWMQVPCLPYMCSTILHLGTKIGSGLTQQTFQLMSGLL